MSLQPTTRGLSGIGDYICLLTMCSRFIHREPSRHKYAVAWTTKQDPKHAGGGHFFFSSHAIKVESAADTVVVWKPTTWHGTSLQNRDPNDTKVFQGGLAIATPAGIDRLWRDERLSLEEAQKKCLELESEELVI